MVQLKRKVSLKQKQSKDPKKPGINKSRIFGLAMLPVIIILGVLLFKSFISNNSTEKISKENGKNIVAEKDTKDENVSDGASQKDSKRKEKREEDASSKEKEQIAAKEKQKETSVSNVLDPDAPKDNQQPKTKQTAVDVKTEEPNTQIPYKKGNIYKVYQFPFGESDYSKPNPDLDKLVQVLKENPAIKITISAYTDKIGDADYNQALSVKRAKAIRDYIASQGIKSNRLSFQGKGISTKYQSNSENRRAEFVLSD